jgi:hypothetical protein
MYRKPHRQLVPHGSRVRALESAGALLMTESMDQSAGLAIGFRVAEQPYVGLPHGEAKRPRVTRSGAAGTNVQENRRRQHLYSDTCRSK